MESNNSVPYLLVLPVPGRGRGNRELSPRQREKPCPSLPGPFIILLIRTPRVSPSYSSLTYQRGVYLSPSPIHHRPPRAQPDLYLRDLRAPRLARCVDSSGSLELPGTLALLEIPASPPVLDLRRNHPTSLVVLHLPRSITHLPSPYQPPPSCPLLVLLSGAPPSLKAASKSPSPLSRALSRLHINSATGSPNLSPRTPDRSAAPRASRRRDEER
jgi:hypothetical protein